jgi:hypothetical protein
VIGLVVIGMVQACWGTDVRVRIVVCIHNANVQCQGNSDMYIIKFHSLISIERY